ncbi:hypothetical protein [Dermabacter hominis]|uniref:hypothetical protein n=1 Tax=Dermabacter hominis TaxID=36740 RepID=UPI002A499768|nr:hypothetical protein [Dermabacter hominis]
MKNTSRGLELTRTEWVSDTERFYRVVKDAARNAASELQREIGYGNPGNFVIYANQIAAISEIWFWARGVSCDYENTPAVLIAVPKYARHISEWREEDGPVLWWRDTPTARPYVGTRHDKGFDVTYKWWSPIDTPEIPESETHE